ncbi:MAG: aminotransferase class I/II-fold pyridoxal phosphate-dependent enzyme [Lachnospiraceae bacterium]|nr:aminotransferase class I/II-fold pyridoxal phosphate-dependent enzyme [Lachnospiraceae bacterium]
MRKGLFEALKEYGDSDHYPLHMPGHKRRGFESFNPYNIDITEIEGFDDLHDAKGLIRDAEDRAAALYGARRTYLLVNGVTGGILAALSALTCPGDTVLMARNCHRAVYGGLIAADLKTCYLYPEYAGCLMGGIRPEAVSSALSENPHIKTVIITSPTYEGFVSDIREIASICHEKGALLIVDEAHGAHMHFSGCFPASAVEYADIVLHGAHKTLPAFTQTGFLHIASDRVDRGRLESFLRIYQTSSPSYILMAGLERCISFLENEGKESFAEYGKLLEEIRGEIGKCRAFTLADNEYKGKAGIYDIDWGKLVIMPHLSLMTGYELAGRLREDYHLECEMADRTHIIAMTSVMDTKEGLGRLVSALNQMDKPAEYISEGMHKFPLPKSVMTMRAAFTGKAEYVGIEEASGRTAADLIYAYPPGIPLVAPGEAVTDQILDVIREYRDQDQDLKGLFGESRDLIKVVI